MSNIVMGNMWLKAENHEKAEEVKKTLDTLIAEGKYNDGYGIDEIYVMDEDVCADNIDIHSYYGDLASLLDNVASQLEDGHLDLDSEYTGAFRIHLVKENGVPHFVEEDPVYPSDISEGLRADLSHASKTLAEQEAIPLEAVWEILKWYGL